MYSSSDKKEICRNGLACTNEDCLNDLRKFHLTIEEEARYRLGKPIVDQPQ